MILPTLVGGNNCRVRPEVSNDYRPKFDLIRFSLTPLHFLLSGTDSPSGPDGSDSPLVGIQMGP